MSFTITRSLELPPSHSRLAKLAEKMHVHVSGDERSGSFSGRGVEGNYEFDAGGLRGNFAGHGVAGTFSFKNDKATVTITDKPFWLPEMLLQEKIGEGLDKLRAELV